MLVSSHRLFDMHPSTIMTLAICSRVRNGCRHDGIEDNMIAEYDIRMNTVRQNYWDQDLFGGRVLRVRGDTMCIGWFLMIMASRTVMRRVSARCTPRRRR